MRTFTLALLMAGCALDDVDGDGLSAEVDCDDGDATRGGAEVPADQVDNDCDGAVDCQDDDLVHGELWYGNVDLWEGDTDVCADVDCRVVVGALWMDGGSRSDDELDTVPGLDLSCVTHVTESVDLMEADYPFRGLRGLTEVAGIGISYSSIESFQGLRALRRAGSISVFDSEVGSLEGLENLTSVDSIGLGPVSGLTSLDGLSGIRWVPGTLWIEGEDIASLRGLHNLEAVGTTPYECHFQIRAGRLETLAELESLRVIGCSFGVGSTPITDLTGLERVTRIGGLGLAHLDHLVSLDGVEQIEGMGSLSLADVPALTSLSALAGLRSIGGVHIGEPYLGPMGVDLGWHGADALTSLDGLDGLDHIAGSLYIGGNDRLESVDALIGVSWINGDLVIDENLVLGDLSGLSSVREVSGDVIITENPALGDAAAQALVDGITLVGGTVTIADNGS